MQQGTRRTIAMVSAHADPLARLGRGDNGGMNLSVRRLAGLLGAGGYPNDVFTRRSGTAPAEVSLGPDSRLVRIAVGDARPLSKSEVAELCGELAGGIDDWQRDAGRSYALIHGHHWLGGMVSERLASLWGVPWVQSFHTLASLKAAAGLPVEEGREEIEQRFVRRADRLVAMSRSEARELIDHYGADPNRVCVAHPGTDSNDISEAEIAELRTTLGLDGRRIVVFAGRLDPLKGADTLLDALACVMAGSDFADVVAMVAGDEAVAGERARLEEIADRNGIRDQVRFVGSLDHAELARYFRLANVCVFPSRTETFGLVALEAAAAGRPVVAAAVGGLLEIVRDGETGFLLDPDDISGFCRRITEVLSDAALAARLGTAAHQRAAEFTWQRSASRLASIYDAVLERSTVGCPDEAAS